MHQKNKPLHQKSTIVEFSNLNDNNKTQFLQFLLRNNITFEKTGGKGHDDYVAKVTLPKPNPKANKENNTQIVKNTSSNVENIKSSNKNKTLQVQSKNVNNTSISKSPDNSIRINTPKKTKLANFNGSLIKNSSTPLNENKKANNTIQPKSPKSHSNRNINKAVQKPSINMQGVKKSSPITVRTTSEFLTHQNLQLSIQNLKNKGVTKIDKMPKKMDTEGSSKKISKNSLLEIKNKNASKQKQNFYLQKEKSQIQKSRSTQKYQKLKKETVQKQKIVEVNNQIKRKTEEQKQICELVNRYLKLFNLKLLGQRPIKWSLLQVIRTIQQIYNELFIKNTQSLAQKGYSRLDQYGSGNQSNNNFVKFIKQYFGNKHKNEKLATSNMINMLYSLCCYLQNQKKISHTSHPHMNILANLQQNSNTQQIIKQIKENNKLTSTGIFLQIFEDFLCQIYQFEELLFYLFIRSIIMNELQTLNHGNLSSKTNKIEKESKNIYLMEKQIYMNYKDIIRVLGLIFGQDQDLIEEYKLMLLTRLNYLQKKQESEMKISAPQFMTIMVEDYRVKRLLVQQNAQTSQLQKNPFNNSIEHNSITEESFEQIPLQNAPKKKDPVFLMKNQINNGCVNINQNQTDQLTFGQQTQSNMDKMEDQQNMQGDISFWESSQYTEIFKKAEQYSLQALICQKMKKKVRQFYNILVENKSEYNSLQNKKNSDKNEPKIKSYDKNEIKELLTKKSINLLGSIVQMNKLKWFEQLRVTDPNQEDIDKVEELQLTYRRLKSNPDADSIGKLCKNILTVPQFTIALQKLIFM